MPKALVTGCAGFVGWHMVNCLLDLNYEVVGTDIIGPDPAFFQNPNFSFVKADLTDPANIAGSGLLDKLTDVDVIFHVAGLFTYHSSLEKLFKVNVDGTLNLIKALAQEKKGKRMIVWGAAGVFGNFDHIPLPATEEMTPKTDNPYLLSKLYQERLALESGRYYKIPVTVIRPSAIYGSRSCYGMAISINTILKSKLAFVIGSGKHRGALVHVRDVVRAAEFLARRSEAESEIYHITDDALYTVHEITQYLAHLCGARFVPFKVPRWLAFKVAQLSKIDYELVHLATINAWLSNEKIKKLGFEFKYSDSRAGLAETVAWYKKELGYSV